MYTLPSTLEKRSCSFGYGNKISLNLNNISPPPGSYKSVGDLSSGKKNTISFSPGRNEVKFGYFLLDAERKKTLPSPDRYKIKMTHYSNKYGKMAAKLPSDIELSAKNKNPGPGSYDLDAT